MCPRPRTDEPRTVDVEKPAEPAEWLALSSSDQSTCGRSADALSELQRLVTDIADASSRGRYLRALSGLVAIQPLTNLLMSLQQEALENGAQADGQLLGSPQDGGYV